MDKIKAFSIDSTYEDLLYLIGKKRKKP